MTAPRGMRLYGGKLYRAKASRRKHSPLGRFLEYWARHGNMDKAELPFFVHLGGEGYTPTHCPMLTRYLFGNLHGFYVVRRNAWFDNELLAELPWLRMILEDGHEVERQYAYRLSPTGYLVEVLEDKRRMTYSDWSNTLESYRVRSPALPLRITPYFWEDSDGVSHRVFDAPPVTAGLGITHGYGERPSEGDFIAPIRRDLTDVLDADLGSLCMRYPTWEYIKGDFVRVMAADPDNPIEMAIIMPVSVPYHRLALAEFQPVPHVPTYRETMTLNSGTNAQSLNLDTVTMTTSTY